MTRQDVIADLTLRNAALSETCLVTAAAWKSVMVRLSGSACDTNSGDFGVTPEGKVKALVKRALVKLGAYSFMPVQNGMGAPSLDFINCLDGNFFSVETKVVGKELTPRQKITAKAMAQAGARVYVIRDQADVDYMVADVTKPFAFRPMIYDTMWTDNNVAP